MNIFKHCFFWINCLFLAAAGCNADHNYITSYSTEEAQWCFHEFEDRAVFEDFVSINKDSAKGASDVGSMEFLGCAYYQQGDLKNAEKWLTEAYKMGGLRAPAALSAIYLKEGDLGQAEAWMDRVNVETNLVRWVKVIGEIKKYEKYDNPTYLLRAQNELSEKINYEGSTHMTTDFLAKMNTLLEQTIECRNASHLPECSSAEFRESFDEGKNYMDIMAKGLLAQMVPVVPKSWLYPVEEEQQKQQARTKHILKQQQAEAPAPPPAAEEPQQEESPPPEDVQQAEAAESEEPAEEESA